MALVEDKWVAHRNDLAKLMHVNPETVGSWAARSDTTGCPPALGRNSGGPWWDASEVIRWWATWKPIKSAKLPKLGWVEPAILKELGLENVGRGDNGDKAQD